MAELRQNLATKDWVIIASERAQRPRDFIDRGRHLTAASPAHDPECPFCPGNEQESPEEFIRWPEGPDWQLRLVANRFPALRPDQEHRVNLEGLCRCIAGVGYHDVLIDSPLHNMTLALQPPEEIQLALRAFQVRGRQMLEDPRIHHVVYYKNHGPAAGTSLAHPHWQILGMPMVPTDTRRRIEEARHCMDDRGHCPYCEMIASEQEDGRRIVLQNEHFVAFVPYAAPSPYHLWVLPVLHHGSFLDATAGQLAALSQILRTLFGKLYRGLSDPDYNTIIRSAPRHDMESDYLHWYLTIVPRVTKSAGFELGSGMYINPLPPEESAAFLRGADPGEPLHAEPAAIQPYLLGHPVR